MFWRWLAVLCAMLAVLSGLQRPAFAQGRGAPAPKAGASVVPPGSTPVLTFESDDAEEQADAFTTALRARIKAAPGWTLSENTFSLGILTAALKCRLDAPCLQRVGDQLKTDKFFWGKVTRVGKTQVSVEAHHWQRGKHDSVVKETYSDDLRDPNSEGLKKVASRIFERLTNTLTTGTVSVKAGRHDGQVLVDGVLGGQLTGGQAVLELKPGSYAIEVRAEGFLPVRQQANVVVGAETQLSFELAAPAPPPEPVAPEKPFATRKFISYGLIGAGAVGGIIGVVQLVRWFSAQSEIDDLRSQRYGLQTPPGQPPAQVDDPCAGHPYAANDPAAQKRLADACKMAPDGESISTVGFIAGGVGAALIGTGVVLLLTDKTPKDPPVKGLAPATTAKTEGHWTVVPSIGPRQGSLHVGLTF